MSPQQAQCPPVMNHFLKAIRKFLSIPGDPLIAKGDRFDRVFALGLDAQATHFLKAAAAGFGISKNKVLFSPDTEIIRKLYTVIRFLVLAGIHEHRIRLANTIGELNFPGPARVPLFSVTSSGCPLTHSTLSASVSAMIPSYLIKMAAKAFVEFKEESRTAPITPYRILLVFDIFVSPRH